MKVVPVMSWASVANSASCHAAIGCLRTCGRPWPSKTPNPAPSGFLLLCAARLSGASNSQKVAVTTRFPACSPNSRHIGSARQPGRGPPGDERQIEETLDASRRRARRRDGVHTMCRRRDDPGVALESGLHALRLPALDRDERVGVSAELDLVACSRGTEDPWWIEVFLTHQPVHRDPDDH